MAVTDRILRRRPPVKPGPVKPKPKGKGKNPQLPYRSADPGFGPKKRNPGKGNPPVDKTLPRRYDPGFGPKKRPQPVKPKPKGGIRDLLYRAKPGEQMKKNFKSTSAKGFDKAKYEQMIQSGAISIMRPFNKLNNEKSRKDTSPIKRPTPIKIDKVKMAEESYKNYLKQRNEKIRKSEGSVLKGLEKLKKAPRPTGSKDFKYLNMMGPAGPAPKRTPRPAADYMNMMKSGPIRKTKPVTPRRGGR